MKNVFHVWLIILISAHAVNLNMVFIPVIVLSVRNNI